MEIKTQAYHIYYMKEEDVVVMEWRGYATSAQFKEGTEAMLDVLWKSRSKKVFADTREMVMIGMEDQHWVEKEFLPRALKMGFEAMALIRSKHYFNKVAVESIIDNIEGSALKVGYFDDKKSALEWLSQQ